MRNGFARAKGGAIIRLYDFVVGPMPKTEAKSYGLRFPEYKIAEMAIPEGWGFKELYEEGDLFKRLVEIKRKDLPVRVELSCIKDYPETARHFAERLKEFAEKKVNPKGSEIKDTTLGGIAGVELTYTYLDPNRPSTEWTVSHIIVVKKSNGGSYCYILELISLSKDFEGNQKEFMFIRNSIKFED